MFEYFSFDPVRYKENDRAIGRGKVRQQILLEINVLPYPLRVYKNWRGMPFRQADRLLRLISFETPPERRLGREGMHREALRVLPQVLSTSRSDYITIIRRPGMMLPGVRVSEGSDMGSAIQEHGVPDFLTDGSEMAARIRAFDWASTPMGPVSAWPQSVRLSLIHI